MSSIEEREIALSKGTKITIGAVLGLLSMGVAIAGWAASLIMEGSLAWNRMESQNNELRRDVQDVSDDVDELRMELVRASEDRWRREQMRHWAEMAEALNEGWLAPDVK